MIERPASSRVLASGSKVLKPSFSECVTVLKRGQCFRDGSRSDMNQNEAYRCID